MAVEQIVLGRHSLGEMGWCERFKPRQLWYWRGAYTAMAKPQVSDGLGRLRLGCVRCIDLQQSANH